MRSRVLLFLVPCAWLLSGCGERGPTQPDPAGMIPLQEIPQNLLIAATGLDSQPGRLDFHVPVGSSTEIVSARLRWVGRGTNPAGDTSLLVSGHQRLGTLLYTQYVGGESPLLFVYEYDVTSLVRPNNNTLYVSGLDLGEPMRADGAAVIVVYEDDSSPWTAIHPIDPYEFVEGGTGSVWELPIGQSNTLRNGRLVVIAGDAEPTGTDRIWWSAGPGPAPAALAGNVPTVLENRLTASEGSWIDVVSEDLLIPEDADHFAYQLESPADGTGDSIAHVFGVLCIDGEIVTCVAGISGRVWMDDNADGAEDPGEYGIADVSVELQDDGGAVVAQRITDSAGVFSFDGLCAGDYVVVVDKSTLPAGVEPTTCEGGSCSPQAVTLEADDAVVSGLAFGWNAPPAPTTACFYGPGFWSHQYKVLLGERRGRLHVDPAVLEALPAIVASTTAQDWSQGDGALEPRDLLPLLRPWRHDACDRADRSYVTLLLNHAYNGAHRGLPVDTDRDGVPDSTIGDVIDEVETLLADGSRQSCQDAKRLLWMVQVEPADDCGRWSRRH